MKSRSGIIIAVVGLCATVLLVILTTHRQPKPAAPGSAVGQNAAQKQADLGSGKVDVKGLKLREFDAAGKLLWQVLSSGKLKFDRGRMQGRGENVKWALTRGGGQTVTLTAPEFAIDYKIKQLGFSKGVKAQSSDSNINFDAQSVLYDMNKDRLSAMGILNAQVGEYGLEANELALGSKTKTAYCTGNVIMKYRDMVVKAPTVSVDWGKQTARVAGPVKATSGGWQATAGEATVQGDRVLLSGKVTVRQDKVTATAPQVTLDRRTSRATATRGVKLTGEGFTASGGQAVVDVQGKQATVTGGVRIRATVRR